MSNEEQAPSGPGHDPGPDGPEVPGGHEDPTVVDPDDVVLDDGDISADTLEPGLSVSPGSLDLEEPALEPARISAETAEAASLADAAAEARAVAAEAEETGTLVGGPMPAGAPVTEAAPDGTAPAGGAAGDASDAGPAHGRGSHPAGMHPWEDPADAPAGTGGVFEGHEGRDGRGAPDGPGTESGPELAPRGGAAGPAGGPYAFPPQGGPGIGDPDRHPGTYPGTDPAFIGAGSAENNGRAGTADPSPTTDGATAARAAWVPGASGKNPTAADGPALRDRTRPRSSNAPLLLVLGGAVVLLGLLVWLIVSLVGGPDDEERVDPSSLAAGECLADFADITEDAVLVDCAEPHNAQLVASESYPDDAEFPGRDQLGLRAEAACATASAEIDPDVVTEDLQVTLLRATPTTETWADGDRRVDCFAVVEDGGTVTRSLLNP